MKRCAPEHLFPVEIWTEILSYTLVREVVNLGMLSRRFYKYFGETNQFLWKRLLQIHHCTDIKEGKCAYKKYKNVQAYMNKEIRRRRKNFAAPDVNQSYHNNDIDSMVKYLLIGDMGVGKTSIYHRYLVRTVSCNANSR
jgi:hypothetical protein